VDALGFLRRTVKKAGIKDSRYWEDLLEGMRRLRDDLEGILGTDNGEGEWQERLSRELSGAPPERKARLLELRDALLDMEEVLIVGHLRLVLHVAARYFDGGIGSMEDIDIVQEGCRGLLTAARRHDLKGYAGFSTYAVFIIRRCIIEEVSRQSKLVRVPRQMLRRGARARSLLDSFVAEHGRLPTLEEMNSCFDLEMDWLLALSLLDLNHDSLDCHSGREAFPVDNLPDRPAGQPHLEVAEEMEMKRLAEAVLGLPERSRMILVLRMGLHDNGVVTLKNVAEIMGISIERVRQIEKEALEKLRVNLFAGSDKLLT